MEINLDNPGHPIGGGVGMDISWGGLAFILAERGILKPNESLRAVTVTETGIRIHIGELTTRPL